jgi:crossover junction endodeoxyribonuclease RusA
MWRSIQTGRYSRTVLSKRARERRDLIVEQIHQRLGGRPEPMAGSVAVQMTVTPRDKRTPDVDAHIKHLLDCLAHAGIYEDDRQVTAVYVERMPTPQHPGSVTVEVWPIHDDPPPADEAGQTELAFDVVDDAAIAVSTPRGRPPGPVVEEEAPW